MLLVDESGLSFIYLFSKFSFLSNGSSIASSWALRGYKGSLFPVWQGFTIYFGWQEEKKQRKEGGREGEKEEGSLEEGRKKVVKIYVLSSESNPCETYETEPVKLHCATRNKPCRDRQVC